jgi:hypothetical protein
MRALPNIDEIGPRRYIRPDDRNAHPSTSSPPPDTGRGDARVIVTCGRGFRGAFLTRNSARSPVPAFG